MRYRKLGYIALNVTDLDRSANFYRDLLGLEPTGNVGPESLSFRCSANHHDVLLYRAAEPGVKRVGWELESQAELKTARRELAAAGLALHEVSRAECAQLRQGATFRVAEPTTEIVFEYYAEQEKPAAGYQPTIAKIARLGHVVFNVARYDDAVRSLTTMFNFRVSDVMEEMATFMRCFPNPFHHSLAVARSDATRLNHVNFMVTDIDDVGQAMNRMQDSGVPIVFGPGRHAPSDSIFLYFLDPDGMTIEYSFGMEEFPEHNARAPRLLPKKLEILDRWGGRPKPGMGAVGAIEGLS